MLALSKMITIQGEKYCKVGWGWGGGRSYVKDVSRCKQGRGSFTKGKGIGCTLPGVWSRSKAHGHTHEQKMSLIEVSDPSQFLSEQVSQH